MGKYSHFKRRAHDAYDTPESGILPLLSQIPKGARFAEPCAGHGDMVHYLVDAGYRLTVACDIEPRGWFMGHQPYDALNATRLSLGRPDVIITNPPWTRALLHPMIDRFRQIAPTWLLFDANWMHTKQAASLRYCDAILSVGRISWMGNGTGGKEDAAWFRFVDREVDTQFIGRAA